MLSGPPGPQIEHYSEGSRPLFDTVTASGGVRGRKISYFTLDDGFDPKRAVENTQKLLVDNKVFVFFNSTGTAQRAAVLPLLKESKTILFGPVTGASALRDNFNPYEFHVRASLRQRVGPPAAATQADGRHTGCLLLPGRRPGQGPAGRGERRSGRT